jgi:hypothetical protein
MLTEQHESRQMTASLQNLCHYRDEGEPFVENIITGNETWVYGFAPVSKRNSMTWKLSHSPI